MNPPHFGPIETEDDWLASGEPEQMIRFLGESGTARCWQLFACQCCWRIVPLLVDERSLRAVATAERQAEGLTTDEEVREALEEAHAAEVELWSTGRPAVLGNAATAARRCLTMPRRAHQAVAAASGGAGRVSARKAQCDLLRELFGNPFRPVAVDPAWRTPTVLVLARQIYDDDSFSDLPILGDALEDAGCTEAVLLEHCRGLSPHVRGCWVVDAVLDRR